MESIALIWREKKMEAEYKIPLKFNSGQFGLNELPSDNENFLTLNLEQCDVLSYSVPKDGTEVRLYDITEKLIRDSLFATYDNNGQLKYVELIKDDIKRLIFINYIDNEDAKAEVLDFAEQSADIISNELIKCKDKAARLFIEYYKEVEGFDFAAKIGTVADKQAALDSLSEKARQRGLEKMVVDNSGDYPRKNRIECDRYTLEIMLLCAAREIRSELLDLAINVMTERIKNNVIDVIDKSDDFKFIAAEYD